MYNDVTDGTYLHTEMNVSLLCIPILFLYNIYRAIYPIFTFICLIIIVTYIITGVCTYLKTERSKTQMDPVLTEASLKKLTVPQLKALCKEKKQIAGYSKLNKGGIVAKLLDWQKSSQAVASTLPSTVGDLCSLGSAQPRNGPSEDVSLEATNPSHGTMAVLSQSSNAIADSVAPKPTEDLASGLNIGSNSDSRRPTDPEPRREPLFKEPTTNRINKSDTIQQNSTSKRKVERLEAPVRKKAKVIDTPPLLTPARADAPTFSLDAVGEGLRLQEGQATKAYIAPQKFPIQGSQLSATTRFKALVPKKDNRVMPVIGTQFRAVVDSSVANTSVKHSKVQETADSLQTICSPLDFLREDTVILGPISLPPSVAQRKHISRLALVLSGISLQDLRTCALVSRSFRYAGIFF